MKKILGLTIAALLVMALVGGGTWAYFSDPEYSTGNILTAGTLDLSLNGGDADVRMLNFGTGSEIIPGANGTPSVILLAGGNLTGELDIAITTYNDNADVGSTEFENATANLGALATMSIYMDVNQANGFDAGDLQLKSDNSIVDFATDGTLDGATMNSFSSASWNDIYTGAFAGPDNFVIDWDVSTAVGNTIQGDSVDFDITFTLEQADAD